MGEKKITKAHQLWDWYVLYMKVLIFQMLSFPLPKRYKSCQLSFLFGIDEYGAQHSLGFRNPCTICSLVWSPRSYGAVSLCARLLPRGDYLEGWASPALAEQCEYTVPLFWSSPNILSVFIPAEHTSKERQFFAKNACDRYMPKWLLRIFMHIKSLIHSGTGDKEQVAWK
jgi:hypothetical protein